MSMNEAEREWEEAGERARRAIQAADKFTWQPGDTDYLPTTDPVTGERIAWDRAEADACERGTPGCSIHHTSDSECQTWRGEGT